MIHAQPILLLVDYNLSRVADVRQMACYAKVRYGAQSLLIRSTPTDVDRAICDGVIDLNPRDDDFVERALVALAPYRARLAGGLVFSDNAVQSGALLLEALGLAVDSGTLAEGAFSKHAYRSLEHRHRDIFGPQGVMVPDCAPIRNLADLTEFAVRHPGGFVVKPSCEGNNRGVVTMRQGDDLAAVLKEVSTYLSDGVICEELIPYRREFSFDGIGSLSFITEKISATGRYPVELGQVLPARITPRERNTISVAGRLANLLVGQRNGPFHNEIKLSDDGHRAAVVEPNRRPAGMKIWTIASLVYQVNLYHLWVDQAFGEEIPRELPQASRQAATVMLGVAEDTDVISAMGADASVLLDHVVLPSLQSRFPSLRSGDLELHEFCWLPAEARRIHAVPRDNADFIAQVCLTTTRDDIDIRDLASNLQTVWKASFHRYVRGSCLRQAVDVAQCDG